MSSVQKAVALLAATLKKETGQPIFYTNGVTTWEITATRTRPKANQSDDADGIIFGSKSWHWIITAADLDGTEPALGHMITDADGVEYKVQPSNPNDLAYRYADSFKTIFRVFTEQQ